MPELRKRLEASLLRQWYKDKPGWSLALSPLAGVVRCVSAFRYRRFSDSATAPAVPLLVVGNISVGGTGKTPLVIALCKALQQRDCRVVVISRGYGSQAPHYPFVVTAASKVAESGDEPLLIARRAGVSVVIDANRRAALQAALLLEPDVIISDDGLQHYRLPRSAELAVLDGKRGLGNGWCLPTGPLRESRKRLERVDWVVINGGDFRRPGAYRMQLAARAAVNLASGETRDLATFADTAVTAVAAIGNPERFFATLEGAGLCFQRHAFPDHYAFSAADFSEFAEQPVIMTEKDAVKCAAFATQNHWYLPVEAELPEPLVTAILERLVGVMPNNEQQS